MTVYPSGGAPVDLSGGGVVTSTPPPQWSAQINDYGLLARFSPIKGVTSARTLDHKIWLPAVVNSLAVDDTAAHSEYDTISGGQFSMAQQGRNAVQLRDVPLDSLLMAWDPRWFTVTRQNEVRLRMTLVRILQNREAVQLLVTWHPHSNPYPPIDMAVTFRSLRREIRAGENDTTYLSLGLKQWRNPKVNVLGHNRPPSRSSRKSGVRSLPTTHKLTAKDTLYSLSYEFYGRHDEWKRIRDANGITHKWGAKSPVVKLKGRWKVGTKIKIPKLPSGGGSSRPSGGGGL